MPHTPGPWVWEHVNEPGSVPVNTLRGPTVLCRWWKTKPDPTHENPADAKLIAAAPDLLTALIEAEYFFKDDFPDGVDGPCAVTPRYREAYRAMHSAIAKATGQ